MNDLAAQNALATLAAQLSTQGRRALLRGIATDVLREQRNRITRQQNPDRSAFAARRIDPRRKDQRRGTMFKRLRMARNMDTKVGQDQLTVSFAPRARRVAMVNQLGEMDSPRKGMHKVRYPIRELLGISQDTECVVREAITVRLLR